jgi:hypothetical protein
MHVKDHVQHLIMIRMAYVLRVHTPAVLAIQMVVFLVLTKHYIYKTNNV